MNYLIPANSKKSMLIFGIFTPTDLIIFGCGIAASLIMLLAISPKTIPLAVIDMLPVSVTGFLVFPIPNYHNMMTVIQNIWIFYMYPERRQYGWKGWCCKDGEK